MTFTGGCGESEYQIECELVLNELKNYHFIQFDWELKMETTRYDLLVGKCKNGAYVVGYIDQFSI